MEKCEGTGLEKEMGMLSIRKTKNHKEKEKEKKRRVFTVIDTPFCTSNTKKTEKQTKNKNRQK